MLSITHLQYIYITRISAISFKVPSLTINKGAKSHNNIYLGAKSRPNENIYNTAKRICNCLLNIQEEYLNFFLITSFKAQLHNTT